MSPKKLATKKPVASKKDVETGSAPKASTGAVSVLIGTRKGAFILKGTAKRDNWQLEGPHLLGNIVNHLVLDPRNNGTMLMAARTGHLGPTIFRSSDMGTTWKEAKEPPKFPQPPDGKYARSVKYTFWLTPGHSSEPNVWYAGTSPHGLFRSEDGGETWKSVPGYNDNEDRQVKWSRNDEDGTPDGAVTHSILIDSREKNHIFVSQSGGGTFESRDGARTFRPLNNNVLADFQPEKYPIYGQDPHRVHYHPMNPDRLYQQNHCGIYRLDRDPKTNPEDKWIRIGDNMPREVGDIGFPIVLDPRNADQVWVFPMDGTDVWPRTSPDGRPCVYKTTDAGQTWIRQDSGMPDKAWWTVRRQCMTSDSHDPLGLYFGTTSGELWASFDAGVTWKNLLSHLPMILSVEVTEL